MKVYSIFKSISGEAGPMPQGTLTTFVRLAGCNLRCTWCDTPKTWTSSEEQEMNVDQVVQKIEEIGLQHVLFTGGEPLLQAKELSPLIKRLNKMGCIISIETNGTVNLESLGKVGGVNWVVDYKLPSSGIHNPPAPLEFAEGLRKRARRGDDIFVKFVCQDDFDFRRAQILCEYTLKSLLHRWDIRVAFSPAAPLTAAKLAELMLEDDMGWAILSMQIHKVIWPEGEVEK